MDETQGAASAPTTEGQPPATGSAEGAPPSPQPSQEPKFNVRAWFDRHMLGRTGPDEDAGASAAATTEGGEGDAEDQAPSGPAATPGQKRELTDEEFARAVQAEVDRRAAKQAQTQRAEARKRLRDDDPEAYAAQERADEAATEQFTSHANLVIGAYDEAVLTPVMAALPEKERAEVIGAGISGLDGRTAAIGKALEALKRSEYERGKADGAKDAETKLRKNPAVLKQVILDEREDTEEPDLIPAGGAPPAKVSGNSFLRDLYRASRS